MFLELYGLQSDLAPHQMGNTKIVRSRTAEKIIIFDNFSFQIYSLILKLFISIFSDRGNFEIFLQDSQINGYFIFEPARSKVIIWVVSSDLNSRSVFCAIRGAMAFNRNLGPLIM